MTTKIACLSNLEIKKRKKKLFYEKFQTFSFNINYFNIILILIILILIILIIHKIEFKFIFNWILHKSLTIFKKMCRHQDK